MTKRCIDRRHGYPVKTCWIGHREQGDTSLSDDVLADKYLGPLPPRSLKWSLVRFFLAVVYWGCLGMAVLEVIRR
jgi:hypothetical protein